MAEGFLRHMGKGAVEVYSAGTHPSTVHPLAIRAMREVGIDIIHQRSKSVNEFVGEEFDYVITVCDPAIRRDKRGLPCIPGSASNGSHAFR